MTLEQRFLTGFREVPTDTPGLVLENDGSVDLVAPGGQSPYLMGRAKV